MQVDGHKIRFITTADDLIPGMIEAPFDLQDPSLYYFKDGKVLHKPKQPSPNHFFDYEKCEWFEYLPEITWDDIRAERDGLIKKTDWTQLPDVQANMTKEDQAYWLNYRQSLRDITLQADPNHIDWPI